MGSAIKRIAAILSVVFVATSCGEDKPIPSAEPIKIAPEPKVELAAMPIFNADSAYSFVEKQVSFGPRVPNSDAQLKCARWLENKLKSFGLKVNTQKAKVTAYNGEELQGYNIMGQFNPEAKERVLLCAHWDSRPYADRDSENRNKPIDGANDGASGVGVLLEIARAISSDSLKPNVGYDIVFFDAEDYGKPEGSMIGKSSDSWCLGSQYWANNLPIPGYTAKFGILLDMVGSPNAVFPKEGVSMHFAPHIVNRVWKTAHSMGYSQYFKNFNGSEITDDHLYLNQIANIPTIDIIHYEMGRMDFWAFHHTHEDNMSGIEPTTLKVVGEVVMQVLYQE